MWHSKIYRVCKVIYRHHIHVVRKGLAKWYSNKIVTQVQMLLAVPWSFVLITVWVVGVRHTLRCWFCQLTQHSYKNDIGCRLHNCTIPNLIFLLYHVSKNSVQLVGLVQLILRPNEGDLYIVGIVRASETQYDIFFFQFE